MRVGVHLGDQMPTGGGGFTFVEQVLAALAEQPGTAHQFMVLGSGPQLEQASNHSFPTVTLDRPRFGRTASAAGAVGRFVRSRGAADLRVERSRWMLDLMLDHGIEFVWYLTPACPVLDLPFLTVIWDLQHRIRPFFPEVSAAGEWRAREDEFATVAGRATFLLTGNDAGRREIEHFYRVPSDRIRLAPHPTPVLPPPDHRILERLGLDAGFLLYPAQLWPHKNHVRLVEAIARLAARGRRFEIVLTGSDQGNEAHIRQVASDLGVADQVRIVGFVERAELASLYERALALTYVSYFGPENLPPLEAFSLGCPVIAADVAGASEQLGDAAILVDTDDAVALASAIERIADEPELRAGLVERGRRRAEETPPAAFVATVVDLLDEFETIRRTWR